MQDLAISLKNNSFLRQYQMCIGAQTLTMEYTPYPKKIFLTKLIAPEATEQDKNLFISSILQDIEKEKLRVVPTSPYTANFFRKNKQYKDLLAIGIKL